MKRKVLWLTIIGVLVLSGVVSAASAWGTYKGYNIIRITIDGAAASIKGAPAINFQGTTLVPVNVLNQANIGYTWDQKNQTVNIMKPPSPDVQAIRDIPVGWLKLYHSAGNEYKNLNDFALHLSIHLRDVGTTMDIIMGNGDPAANFNFVDDRYKTLVEVQTANLSRFKDTEAWMKNNNLTPRLLEVNDMLEKALRYLNDANDSLKQYSKYKNKNYADDYFFNLDKAGKTIDEASKIASDEYAVYYQLLQNYK